MKIIYMTVVIALFQPDEHMFRKESEKPHIIYAYDALCGWCYGFGPVIRKFAENHKDEISMEVLSGGIHTDNNIPLVSEVAPYIRSSYQYVERKCGVSFGEKFLNKTLNSKSARWTSLPSAIALTVMKQSNPAAALTFSGLLQNLVYKNGNDPEDMAAYQKAAEQAGYQGKDFKSEIMDPVNLLKTREEFKKVKELGISGFPAVIFIYKGNKQILTEGYISLEELEKKYQSLIK